MAKYGNETVKNMLHDTIKLMCKNGLAYKEKFTIEGTIGVTIDDQEIFLMSMNDLVTVDKQQSSLAKTTKPLRKRKLLAQIQVDVSPQKHKKTVKKSMKSDSTPNKSKVIGVLTEQDSAQSKELKSDLSDVEEDHEDYLSMEVCDEDIEASENDHIYTLDAAEDTVGKKKRVKKTIMISPEDPESGYGLRSEVITEEFDDVELIGVKQEAEEYMSGEMSSLGGTMMSLRPRKQFYAFCNVCRKGFQKKADIAGHMYQHTGRTQYLCTKCGKQYRYQRGLEQHVRIKHKPRNNAEDGELSSCEEKPKEKKPKKKYHAFCSECNKGFHRKEDIFGHMYRHTGIKRYACEECGKQYRYKRGLVQHTQEKHNKNPDVKVESKDTDDESRESEEESDAEQTMEDLLDSSNLSEDKQVILEVVAPPEGQLVSEEIFASEPSTEYFYNSVESGDEVVLEIVSSVPSVDGENVIVEQLPDQSDK